MTCTICPALSSSLGDVASNQIVGHCQVTDSGELSQVEQNKTLRTFSKYTDMKACACRTSDGDDARCIGVYFSLFVGDVHCSQVRLIFSRCQLPSDLEGQMLDLVGQSLQDLMPKYISMPLVCYPFAIRTRGWNNFSRTVTTRSNA